jgi:hypothetical protein
VKGRSRDEGHGGLGRRREAGHAMHCCLVVYGAVCNSEANGTERKQSNANRVRLLGGGWERGNRLAEEGECRRSRTRPGTMLLSSSRMSAAVSTPFGFFPLEGWKNRFRYLSRASVTR